MVRPSIMPSVLFRLILVRHGETFANKESRMQGHSNLPINELNEIGLDQATKAGVALSCYEFQRAYTSDLKRAQQTAENILKENKAKSVPSLQIDPRVRERGFGVQENILVKDAMDHMRKIGKGWPEFTPEGGETMGDVDKRAHSFFKTMCQSVYDKHYQGVNETSEANTCDIPLKASDIKEGDWTETILLVTHGAFIQQLLRYFQTNLGCVFPRVLEFPCNTGFSIFSVRYSPSSKYSLVCHEYNNGKHNDGNALTKL